MDFTLLEKTVAVFWDEKDNFFSKSTQQKIGKELFMDAVSVHSLEDFQRLLDSYPDNNQRFLFFVHLFHNDERKGYFTFRSSKIQREYPNLIFYYISSAPKNQVRVEDESVPVHSYDNYHGLVGNVFKPQTKGAIMGLSFEPKKSTDQHAEPSTLLRDRKIDYAIITAMYKDEFEEVEELFEWGEDIKTATKRFRMGHLKGNPEKTVVAAIPGATGMVDAAITATLLLELFRPAFLLMAGVCGGKQGVGLGDVVVAKKLFTFQKGKVSDIKDAKGNELQLFDNKGAAVDYDQLFDDKGRKIDINIEKFEIEQDSIIDFDPLMQDILEPFFENIKGKINKDFKAIGRSIEIHFDSMACSTMVIDRDGYFEQNIKVVDRKTIAVEMESYGVARAAKYANDGNTKCIIAKSVMDNMKDKDDSAKRLAARTSAQFLRHLIYDGILDKVRPTK